METYGKDQRDIAAAVCIAFSDVVVHGRYVLLDLIETIKKTSTFLPVVSGRH